MWKFVPKKYKVRWIFHDLWNIIVSFSNITRLRKVMGEMKARNRYESWHLKYFKEYLNCPTKKPDSQVFKELICLWKYWGVFPFQYYIYGMYEKDAWIGPDKMKDYMPEHFAYYWFYSYVNGKNHKELTNKKYLSTQFLALSIDAPQLFLFYENDHFYDSSFRKMDAKEAIRSLPDQKNFVSKPYTGFGGKDIFFFTKDIFKESKWKSILPENAIVQEKIENSKEIKAFHPNSLNTFRIIVKQSEQGPEVLFAFLRFGVGASDVDNIHMGGLFVGIDIDKGILFDVAYDNHLKEYFSHPDSNIVFKGFLIPSWEDIKTFVLEATQKFNQLNIYGWDIALTDQGPKAIEINSMPDVHLIHSVFGGLRKKFDMDQEMIREVGI